MLDTTTKRRIDTARDILVGKVPDPKSQVEQITIALIYKFMDDMDADGEELGGKRKFFAGDYERYGWAKLMRSGLGGHETLNLYAEAIAKMPENPGIPALFRDIFKNAYLPYRDPETLKSFLKIIDEFEYDHSERLGDAFEYLLSVLGSQGDAGQFRTPRHIIDFMVAIISPKKNEVVLDPACGTAGFLISAYKHILKSNTDANGMSTLTPDDRRKMAENFKGYDISPDMVRLSLVNLYLHGFTNPSVFEYDTLTSEDRWKETADVILANPPFMSPKGGIKPHQRFSIQAKRSEVLFLDYIAEHLNANGRAAIIVPEGIIFQSQTAYVQLRKLLVENSLVAVVSLPAGMFNPYSGVKTSILILDKALAKQATTIGFFKIENDGFSLGAQRREGGKDDLPQVKAEIETYLNALRVRQSGEELSVRLGLVVSKEKVSADGEYNLSGERHREGEQRSSEYPHVPLGEVVDILDSLRRPITKGDRKTGPYPYYGATGILDYVEGYLFDEPLVLVGEDGAKWGPGENSAFPVSGKIWVNNHAHVLRPKRDQILDRYLIEILNEADLLSYITGVTVPKLNQEKLRNIQIPLPPLDVQREIVAEIEGYQKIITGARAVLENYRPHIPIKPEWPIQTLAEVCDSILTGPFGSSLHQSDYVETGIPLVNPSNIVDGKIDIDGIKMVSTETANRLQEFKLKKHDLVIGRRGEMGRCAVVLADMDGWLCGTGCFVIRAGQKVDARYLHFQLTAPATVNYLEENAVGVTMKNLNQGILTALSIPLPPLITQQVIVAEIEAEQALVAANRELITRFEAKIQATLARVWGEAKPQVAEA